MAKSFRIAKEWCRSHGDANFGLKLLSDRTTARQYNAPTVSEVSALIINDFGDDLPIRDIVVNKNNTGPQGISELHPSYMALQYPFLFPFDLFVTFTSNPKWPEIAKMLAYIPGQKSYDRPEVDLKMVNKINYATFKATCFAYGLLNDDKEWTHAIAEANLPQPNPNLLTNLDNRLLREALSFDANKSKVEHEKLHLMLNPEQRLIYEQIIESVHNDKGQFCFIHRPGGTGKTFLYKTIITRLRSKQMIVLVVAFSGRTAHSRFVIPLDLMKNSTCDIKQGTRLPELLQHVRLIIWNEAPMNQRYAFEALDKTLQYILGYKNQANRNRIFGGMTVLLGGNFRQILPVIPNAKRPEIVVETYPDFTLRQGNDEYLIERAILTPRNDDADAINENMFKKLGGAPVTYNSTDEICKASTNTVDQHDLYPVYVALSRVTSPDGLKILMIKDEDKEFKNHTCNIVFKEAFNNVS
uniref:ATP-dependent DNA helicase n=1 Tax=Tanacetum cinerariifolium TaxID=118510 RepID=A0A699GTK3_TANCI|nr:hypothetical protein [Tanacetum cinerariifolium]